MSHTGPSHLPFLDGLRGFAALNVALSHVWGITYRRLGSEPLPEWFARTGGVLLPGHWSVCAFIVLSGFCLTLPIARTKNLRLPGGIGRYLQRRAWRILPAYYAALALSLIVIAPWLALTSANNSPGRILLPALAAGPLWSHLLLVHNFSSAWINKILSPAWSIAIEWQIYFLLPLAFMPAWRWFGLRGVVCLGLILGFAAPPLLRFFSGYTDDLGWSFITLFSFGIAAAAVCHRRQTGAPRNMEEFLWRAIVLALAILCLASQASAMRGQRIPGSPRWTHRGRRDDQLCGFAPEPEPDTVTGPAGGERQPGAGTILLQPVSDPLDRVVCG